jgi:hypothetical protein
MSGMRIIHTGGWVWGWNKPYNNISWVASVSTDYREESVRCNRYSWGVHTLQPIIYNHRTKKNKKNKPNFIYLFFDDKLSSHRDDPSCLNPPDSLQLNPPDSIHLTQSIQLNPSNPIHPTHSIQLTPSCLTHSIQLTPSCLTQSIQLTPSCLTHSIQLTPTTLKNQTVFLSHILF